MDIRNDLIQLAKTAYLSSYSPYSQFPVGAALITKNDNIYLGCNVENSSFSMTVCAERNAIFSAITQEGPGMIIQAIVVIAAKQNTCAPCGACRQVIAEFGSHDTAIIYQVNGKWVKATTHNLLHDSFILQN